MSRDLELTFPSFDADLPITCNDEDLNDNVPNPPMGADPPTRMCCFVAAIRLNQILAFALRTIVRSPSPLLGVFELIYCSIQRGGRELFLVTMVKVGKSISLLPSTRP